jgi:hypothetical protein
MYILLASRLDSGDENHSQFQYQYGRPDVKPRNQFNGWRLRRLVRSLSFSLAKAEISTQTDGSPNGK